MPKPRKLSDEELEGKFQDGELIARALKVKNENGDLDLRELDLEIDMLHTVIKDRNVITKGQRNRSASLMIPDMTMNFFQNRPGLLYDANRSHIRAHMHYDSHTQSQKMHGDHYNVGIDKDKFEPIISTQKFIEKHKKLKDSLAREAEYNEVLVNLVPESLVGLAISCDDIDSKASMLAMQVHIAKNYGANFPMAIAEEGKFQVWHPTPEDICECLNNHKLSHEGEGPLVKLKNGNMIPRPILQYAEKIGYALKAYKEDRNDSFEQQVNKWADIIKQWSEADPDKKPEIDSILKRFNLSTDQPKEELVEKITEYIARDDEPEYNFAVMLEEIQCQCQDNGLDYDPLRIFNDRNKIVPDDLIKLNIEEKPVLKRSFGVEKLAESPKGNSPQWHGACANLPLAVYYNNPEMIRGIPADKIKNVINEPNAIDPVVMKKWEEGSRKEGEKPPSSLSGLTPLQHAVKNNRIDLVEVLISKGVDVNKLDLLGKPPLHFALQNNKIEIAKQLIRAGATINSEILDLANEKGLSQNLGACHPKEGAGALNEDSRLDLDGSLPSLS